MTDRYAVIGHPVAHSKSPRIHALFAAQTGQDIDYGSVLAPLDGFEATVREFIAQGGRGMNVTVPFKEQAFRLATQRSPRASAAGAVNTLSFRGTEILGDNTDGAGLVQDIEANLGCAIAARRILLLGAGGAARGCLLPLLERRPAGVLIANRSADKARRLAAEFAHAAGARAQGCGYDELPGQSFDLVINATSAGLSDAALPLPPEVFSAGCLAYEMMYGKQTSFMLQAHSAGARVADGLGMLVEQAAEAFFIWRKVRPATAPILQLLRQASAQVAD